MEFDVRLDHPIIKLSADLTAKHCQDALFFKNLLKVKKFNHTKLSTIEVIQKLGHEAQKVSIVIEGYKTLNPWSKVIGHAQGSTIYINTRKIDELDVFQRCANIYHEFTHLAEFSHDGNRVTWYNNESVPYKTAKIFEQYLRSIYGQSKKESL